MPTKISESTPCIEEEEPKDADSLHMPQKNRYFETDLKWMNIFGITLIHIAAIYILITFPYSQKKFLFFFSYIIIGHPSGFGVTAGAHRLWTHRTYKAKWPLRVILLYCYYSAGLNSLYDWVRDHRIHHKYSETSADPHDSSRGFFFSHVGWLMMKKHPEVIRRGRQVDMSDIVSDPVVATFDKYSGFLRIMCCFVIPTILPVYLWNEDWYYAFVSTIPRYIYLLNGIWSVNSVAHIWGAKPYNKKIAPTENLYVAHAALGEGWHNYHHVFPCDYKAAELGNYKLNLTTALIDMFAKIGWAYDLKQPSKELVRRVIEKRGDCSHPTEEPEPKSY